MRSSWCSPWGAVLPSFPLLLDHFGDGILVWLGLWWPVTAGAGLPLLLMQLARPPDSHNLERVQLGRAGPAGSDAVPVGAAVTVGGALAQPDADPTFIRLLARPVAAALGPPGSRRPAAIRVPLVTLAGLVLVPVLWIWALTLLVMQGRGRWNAVQLPISDHMEERSSPGVNSMVQLLALLVPTARELVLPRRPAARVSPTTLDDAGDRLESAERTFALYRRELGIEDRAVLGLLSLNAAYSLAVVVSALVGLVLGGDALFAGTLLDAAHPLVAPFAFGLFAPLVSFGVWIVLALVADRVGRRAGDYALTTFALAVPVGLALLLARFGS